MYNMLYIVVLSLLSVCCILCSGKHGSGEVLLAGFSCLGLFVKLTGDTISVSTKEKKVCGSFKHSMSFFFLKESFTSCGSLLVL